MLSGCLLVCFSAAMPFAIRRVERKIPMKVKELHISGISELKTPDVTNLLQIHEGDPLYGKLTQKSVEKLKENPRVDRAVVARSITGEVMVNIGERKTEALMNADRLYYIDKDANVLGLADLRSVEKLDLVVMTGPWGGKKSTQGYEDRLKEGVQLKNILVKSGIPEKEISEIHWDETRGFEVFQVGLPARIWMGKTDFEKKSSRLVRVLKDFHGKERSIREIDVNFEDRVVVKLSGVS